MKNSKPSWQHLRLTDRIGPGVRVLLVGINPGVRSAQTGHHFAGPSNRFWKLLYHSKLVPEPLTFVDDVRLPEWGLGITNVVARPSPGIDDLRPAEYLEGWRILEKKVERFRPAIVVLRRRDALPRAGEGPGRFVGDAGDRARFSAGDDPRRPCLRAAQPERAQRELQLRGDAGGISRAAPGDDDQCAAIGPPPRGRFISRTSGSNRRKITPSSRKSPTNDTIDACCCTIPNSAP